MKEILLKAYDAIEWFCNAYGLYLASGLTGFLVGMAMWFKRRPEDFIHTDAEDEQPEAADER